MCVFSRHDLIQDPPFSKLDVISCRNVLIFFGSVRKNVISLFHYALNPGAFLVLGPAETLQAVSFRS
jgi:two-component system, chemotaxis family, CheB/CheR fusion protein